MIFYQSIAECFKYAQGCIRFPVETGISLKGILEGIVVEALILWDKKPLYLFKFFFHVPSPSQLASQMETDFQKFTTQT